MTCFPGPNVRSSKIRGAQCDVQQRALSGGLIVRDGGFVQMAEVVQLVAVDRFEHPSLRAGPLVRIQRIDGARGVEIAVLLLRRADLRDQSVDIRFELADRE